MHPAMLVLASMQSPKALPVAATGDEVTVSSWVGASVALLPPPMLRPNAEALYKTILKRADKLHYGIVR